MISEQPVLKEFNGVRKNFKFSSSDKIRNQFYLELGMIFSKLMDSLCELKGGFVCLGNACSLQRKVEPTDI
jgi:hypothetical protein